LIAIGLQQIGDTPTRGRNPVNLIMTLPGMQTLASNDYRGWSGGGIPGVNGGQTGRLCSASMARRARIRAT